MPERKIIPFKPKEASSKSIEKRGVAYELIGTIPLDDPRKIIQSLWNIFENEFFNGATPDFCKDTAKYILDKNARHITEIQDIGAYNKKSKYEIELNQLGFYSENIKKQSISVQQAASEMLKTIDKELISKEIQMDFLAKLLIKTISKRITCDLNKSKRSTKLHMLQLLKEEFSTYGEEALKVIEYYDVKSKRKNK